MSATRSCPAHDRLPRGEQQGVGSKPFRRDWVRDEDSRPERPAANMPGASPRARPNEGHGPSKLLAWEGDRSPPTPSPHQCVRVHPRSSRRDASRHGGLLRSVNRRGLMTNLSGSPQSSGARAPRARDRHPSGRLAGDGAVSAGGSAAARHETARNLAGAYRPGAGVPGAPRLEPGRHRRGAHSLPLTAIRTAYID